jgi:hypothetical protein
VVRATAEYTGVQFAPLDGALRSRLEQALRGLELKKCLEWIERRPPHHPRYIQIQKVLET